MHVSETLASRDLPDLKLIGKKFCIFDLSCDTWQIYCGVWWENWAKKNSARCLRKQYISPMGTLPQQILTFCNVTCKYTRISCLVLYKLQEIVSRWGIGRSCMALVFRTFLNFLKKRQDKHHLVMFIWSCWKWCHYYERGKPHKGQQRAEPRASIWEAMTCTKVWTVTLGNTNANSMTREVFWNVPCHWRYGDARIFVLQIWQENWPL
jgi:hypothetical protein